MYMHSLILHSIISVLSGFLFFVFSWWWMQYKKATVIYALTCFLMFGLFATHISIAYMYYRKVTGGDLDELARTMIYPCRLYLELFPLVGYVIYVVRKLIKNDID